MLPLLLLIQTPPVPPPGVPAVPSNAPAPATVMAEPLALLVAAADGDGDARTSRAELSASLARSFAVFARGQADIGYLAFADWAKRELGSPTALPSPFEVDRDGDNRITLAELQGRLAAVFGRLDTDKDGHLSRAELLSIRVTGPGPAPGGPDDRRRDRGRDRQPEGRQRH